MIKGRGQHFMLAVPVTFCQACAKLVIIVVPFYKRLQYVQVVIAIPD